jgi:ribosomal protein L1
MLWLVCSIIISIFQVVRVAFFAEGADADEARAAGADIVGGVELIEEIASNELFLLVLCQLVSLL